MDQLKEMFNSIWIVTSSTPTDMIIPPPIIKPKKCEILIEKEM